MTAVLSPSAAFDVCGELPTGTTVLEASAGTGKTFTIAALAARYVAEGHARLPELLLVTFGREATQELRERVRERLVSAERGLRDPAAARTGTDPVLALLADGPDDEVARRRRRLTAALADFDAATIATTHQFCEQMLTALGVAGDAADAVFVESVDDLVTEVVDDFYVRKFAATGGHGPRSTAPRRCGWPAAAVGDPQARLEPGRGRRHRRACGCPSRRPCAARSSAASGRAASTPTTTCSPACATRSPTRSREAAQRLRARYRVVLVDEFQDTDPVQWGILRAPSQGHVPLVLIGDPKQAIYAFRGADVVSYLDAVGQADPTPRWPATGAATPALLAPSTPSSAARRWATRGSWSRGRAPHPGRGCGGAVERRPLRRAGAARRAGVQRTRPRPHRAAAAPWSPATWPRTSPRCSAAGGATAAGDPSARRRRGARPHERPGQLVREALAAVGVPAVLSGTASVFATPAAREWLTLLEARWSSRGRCGSAPRR